MGLAPLSQVVAFEYMLSRTASRLRRALAARRGLSEDALAWLTLHSEFDIRHAEQGLDDLVLFARFYGFGDDDAMTLLEMARWEHGPVELIEHQRDRQQGEQLDHAGDAERGHEIGDPHARGQIADLSFQDKEGQHQQGPASPTAALP